MKFHTLLTLYQLRAKAHLLEFAKNCGLESSLVGERLNVGGQHSIYDYGENQVLKVPRLSFLHLLFGVQSHQNVKLEIELLKKYFPYNLILTEVYPSSANNLYCIVQNKVHTIRYVEPSSEYSNQISEVIAANDMMAKLEHTSLDLIGGYGFKKYLARKLYGRKPPLILHNLIIDENNQLKILDTNLLVFDHNSYFWRRIWKKTLYKLNNYLLRD